MKLVRNIIDLFSLTMFGFNKGNLSQHKRGTAKEPKRATEHDRLRAKSKYEYNLLSRGCKQFTISGVTVIALNEKNAQRKVNNYLNS